MPTLQRQMDKKHRTTHIGYLDCSTIQLSKTTLQRLIKVDIDKETNIEQSITLNKLPTNNNTLQYNAKLQILGTYRQTLWRNWIKEKKRVNYYYARKP